MIETIGVWGTTKKNSRSGNMPRRGEEEVYTSYEDAPERFYGSSSIQHGSSTQFDDGVPTWSFVASVIEKPWTVWTCGDHVGGFIFSRFTYRIRSIK